MATQASSQDQGVQMMGRRRPQRTAGDSFGNHGAVHNVLLCLPCIADFLVLSACSNSKLPAHTSSCWPREQGLILNWLLGDTGEARNTDWHGKFLLFAANCTLRPQPLSCHPCIFIFAWIVPHLAFGEHVDYRQESLKERELECYLKGRYNFQQLNSFLPVLQTARTASSKGFQLWLKRDT